MIGFHLDMNHFLSYHNLLVRSIQCHIHQFLGYSHRLLNLALHSLVFLVRLEIVFLDGMDSKSGKGTVHNGQIM